MAGIELLTVRQIAGLPDGFHSDGGNLYLRKRGDSKSWVYRYKIPKGSLWAEPDAWGKPVEHGLGPYPALPLADARALAKALRTEVANKRSPAAYLKPKVEAAKELKPFRKFAAELIASKEAGWKSGKHGAQWPSTMEAYVYPHIGDKWPGHITAGDVQAILTPLWATKTETATRVRQRVEAIIDYAFVKEDIDKRNPARWKGNLEHLLAKPNDVRKAQGKRVVHHAAPPWADVPTIMAKLREKDSTSAMALRWSVLTAARSGEVRGAEWSEIDAERSLWHVPEGRMKGGEAHSVPLSAEALAILETMATRKSNKSDRIFPGPTGGTLSDVAINKTLAAAYPDITAHGLARSCFRDWCAEATSYPSEVAEAALAHKQPDKVVAAYLRTKFMTLRTAMMKEWGEFLAAKPEAAGWDDYPEAATA